MPLPAPATFPGVLTNTVQATVMETHDLGPISHERSSQRILIQVCDWVSKLCKLHFSVHREDAGVRCIGDPSEFGVHDPASFAELLAFEGTCA